MAKGQVTSDDLATGIKGFGGMSSLGGAPRPVRDNPFRDTRSEAPAPAPVPVVTPAATTVANTPTEPDAPRLEVLSLTEQRVEEERGESPSPRAVPIERKSATQASTKRVATSPRVVPRALATEEPVIPARERKTELYTEPVTVPLNAEMRDRAEALAKDLQRRRTEKSERITANTVIRVALRAMLDTFHPGSGVVVNTEADLYDAVVKHLGRK